MGNLSLSVYRFFTFLFLISLVLKRSNAEVALPVFVFGDSTADVGTNDFLPECQARADVLYNGIDYPSQVPTGRYSNGYNTIDFIAMLMGHQESPLPFLNLSTQVGANFSAEILQGVNFASGGSGILFDTGKQFVQVIPFSQQIDQFTTVYSNISEALGSEAAGDFVKKSIFLFSIGSNDILEYYQFNSSMNYHTFLIKLVNEYKTYLKKLIDIGARKLGIMSVSVIGCVPRARALNITGGCIDIVNSFAQVFFELLGSMLGELSLECQGLIYSLGDIYKMTDFVLKNPIGFGFTEIKSACCGNGTFNGEAPCNVSAYVCSNRNEHLFWDRFHPSQAAANLTALTLYDGSTIFVSPINFRQLAGSNA
ncbi:unnamed protein product [Rhodiola kirilowii]